MPKSGKLCASAIDIAPANFRFRFLALVAQALSEMYSRFRGKHYLELVWGHACSVNGRREFCLLYTKYYVIRCIYSYVIVVTFLSANG